MRSTKQALQLAGKKRRHKHLSKLLKKRAAPADGAAAPAGAAAAPVIAAAAAPSPPRKTKRKRNHSSTTSSASTSEQRAATADAAAAPAGGAATAPVIAAAAAPSSARKTKRKRNHSSTTSSASMSSSSKGGLVHARELVANAAAATARGCNTEAIGMLRACVQACSGSVEPHLALAKALRAEAASQQELDEFEGELRQAITNTSAECDAEECEKGMDALGLLALHLCQEGRDSEAAAVLRALGKKYRLSADVLCYSRRQSPPKHDQGGSTKFLRILDSALPTDMLALMQSAFAPEAPFWREHSYHNPDTGYFSYIHSLSGEPRSALDQVIRHLHALVCQQQPKAKHACYAEWWAHCRPHSGAHQCHWDSDNEGKGSVRNPIFGTVLYLQEHQSLGGPTLMTNQRLGGPLADRGWLVFPRANRLVSFDGSVLHGVVPGRSYTPSAQGRRITFMVAFWKSIRLRPTPDGRPGASQPFPYSGAQQYTWQQPLLPVRHTWGQRAKPKPVLPQAVGTVWEAVGEGTTPVERLSAPPHYDLCFQGF